MASDALAALRAAGRAWGRFPTCLARAAGASIERAVTGAGCTLDVATAGYKPVTNLPHFGVVILWIRRAAALSPDNRQGRPPSLDDFRQCPQLCSRRGSMEEAALPCPRQGDSPLREPNSNRKPESNFMEFRWCAAIALWTILSGPIFHGGSNSARPLGGRPAVNARSAQQQPPYYTHPGDRR